MPEVRSKRGGLLGLLSPAAVAIATFAPVVTYGFVYDDHWTVEGNRALAWPLPALLRALASGRAAALGIPDATRPTMGVSLWVDRHLFGSDPAGYHLHSLLLYGVVTSVAVLALFAVTRRWPSALAGGLAFATMPVHAEVVAAVNYREDLYAALGVLSVVAFLFWPRSRPPLVGHAVLVAALLGVALLGKESAVALVPVVLALAAVQGKGRRWITTQTRAFVAVLAGLFGWSLWRAGLRLAGRDDVPLTLAHRGGVERTLRTARFVVRGAFDALVPFRWSPDYAPPSVASAWWLLPLAALAFAVLGLSLRRRTRPFAAGLAVALVASLPASPLVSPINEIADRYVFLASFGGALVWGTLLERLGRHAPRRLRAWIPLALVLPLAGLSRAAAAPWKTDGSLWRAAVLRAPTSSRAWTGLSRELRLEGDLDGADRAALRAVGLDPLFLRARVTRLYNRLARGEVTRARADIAEIDRLGGARQPGMRLARRCADLVPSEAARCIAPRQGASEPPPL